MMSKAHHSAPSPVGGPGGPAPVVCVLYEDDAEALETLDRLAKAGLGGLPRVMIGVEPEVVTTIPLVADSRFETFASAPVKVA